MKMEAITPFLGKYRPFMGRCCQTCTPKSWVSEGRDGPSLATLRAVLGLGVRTLGSCLPQVSLSLIFHCIVPLPIRGMDMPGSIVGIWLRRVG